MPTEKVRKPRKHTRPYSQKPGPKPRGLGSKIQPKTSAKAQPKHTRENLTLFDWLQVLDFAREHPNLPQAKVVAHFAARAEGALIFSQSALSRKLSEHEELEKQAFSNPTALSSKRPRVVTCPKVERSLVLWHRSMQEKKEIVTGPMLIAKRERFENAFDVPEENRLQGDGWLQSFLQM